MKKGLIAAVILIALMMVGCSAVDVVETEQPQQTAQETADESEETAAQRAQRIDVEATQWQEQMFGNYVLLDVRSYEEFDEGYIEGATLIPLDELADRWEEIEEYDKVLVYCRSGNRSAAASEILLDVGFKEVYNLLGGIRAWDEYKK